MFYILHGENEFDRDEAFEAPVVEHQVDEVLLVADLEAVLAAHEREQPAHFSQEWLDLGEDCVFQSSLGPFITHIEKVEGVLVSHSKPGRSGQFPGQGLLETGLASHGRFVCPELDILMQGSLAPALLFCHTNIKFSLQIIVAAGQYHQMVRPANFSNQWLESFILMVRTEQLSHEPEVLFRKAPDSGKFGLKVLCELFDD